MNWAVAVRTLGMVAVIASAAAIASADDPPSNAHSVLALNKVPGTVESTAHRLTNSFRQQGYEVVRGYFKPYTTADCPRSYEVMHTCFGNNPAAPYVLPVLPPWPDEWVDPATIGAFGETADGYNGSYRLDPREAIVILGVVPPPADYFGIQTYLFTHPGQIDETSTQYQAFARNAPYMLETFFGAVPGNQARLQVMANLGDSTNHVMIASQSGDAWDALRYFVITPDQAMDRAVRNAFARIGIADHDIFTEPIPTALGEALQSRTLTLGLGAGADDFFTAIRYAMPHDGGGRGTRSDAWRHRLPLVVLRIRATEGLAEPYPPATFEARTGTEPPEILLRPDLTTLVKAICQRWGQPCDRPDELTQRAPEFLNMQVYPFMLTGPQCLPIGMNCLAPTEDTTYFLSGKLPLDVQTVYAVVGANSARTQNATYVGLGLNSSLYKLAFDNISDEELAGTADDYGAVPNHDQLFVQYFARDCSGLETLTGGSHCYPMDDLLPWCMEPSDLTCDMLVLSLRSYIRPTTQRGTDPQLALPPRFIRLHRP